MEISPFELLLKPIAPRDNAGDVAKKLLRTVIQGYFLTLSNLEEQTRQIRLNIVISAPQQPAEPSNVSRILEDRTALLFDIAGKNQPLSFSRKDDNDSFIKYETGTLDLPSLATVSIQLLPDVGKFIKNSSSLLEVRGFISIVSVDGEQGDVFLNPEIRGTFIPDNFATNDNPDFDQLSYSLGVRRVTI